MVYRIMGGRECTGTVATHGSDATADADGDGPYSHNHRQGDAQAQGAHGRA